MIQLREPYPNELYHYGIKGQRRGHRRFQNEDGSLTAAGRERYLVNEQNGRRKTWGTTPDGKNYAVTSVAAQQVKRRGSGLGTGKVGSGNDRTNGQSASGDGKEVVGNPIEKARSVEEGLAALKEMLKEGDFAPVKLGGGDFTGRYIKTKDGKVVLEVRNDDGDVVGQLDFKDSHEESLNKLIRNARRAAHDSKKRTKIMYQRSMAEDKSTRW